MVFFEGLWWPSGAADHTDHDPNRSQVNCAWLMWTRALGHGWCPPRVNREPALVEGTEDKILTSRSRCDCHCCEPHTEWPLTHTAVGATHRWWADSPWNGLHKQRHEKSRAKAPTWTSCRGSSNPLVSAHSCGCLLWAMARRDLRPWLQLAVKRREWAGRESEASGHGYDASLRPWRRLPVVARLQSRLEYHEMKAEIWP